MALPSMPSVERLTLATVTTVPEFHPEHGSFEPSPVHAWVIRHPDGVILFDTGVGTGSDVIDEWYRPEVVAVETALAAVALSPADVTAVVLSHLHFDHCGQQAALDAPVFVQAAEHRDAQALHYTVAEWAAIDDARLRLLDGDETIADGVRILTTPGHTAGHQSLVVEGGGERIVIGGQCAYRAHEISTGEPAATNLADPSAHDEARESLARVRALTPTSVHLSHDPTVVELA